MPLVEQLGSFYLGKEYDLKDRQALDRSVNYDSRDLVTHAICVGMTGSGGKHRANARACAQVRYHGSPGLACLVARLAADLPGPVSYTHLRAHETRHDLVCRLLLEKKKNKSL